MRRWWLWGVSAVTVVMAVFQIQTALHLDQSLGAASNQDDDSGHSNYGNSTTLNFVHDNETADNRPMDHNRAKEETLSSSHTLYSVLPTDANTVVATIAMGGTAQSLIAERLLRSIRTGGEFDGRIMIVTDAEGRSKYRREGLLQLDPKVIVPAALPEDWTPRREDESNNNTTKPIKYAGYMKFKRFKTLLDKYVEWHVKDHHEIRFILYLDVDNIVVHPLANLFQDYQERIASEYDREQRVLENATSIRDNHEEPAYPLPSFSFYSMWKETVFQGDKAVGFRWQGGQIFTDRHYSGGCNEAWRFEMDTHPRTRMDQGLLMDVVQDKNLNRNGVARQLCRVLELPKREKHYSNLEQWMLDDSTAVNTFPSIVHITSRRVKMDVKSQIAFLSTVLKLSPLVGNESRREPEILQWDQVALVVDGKGKIREDEV